MAEKEELKETTFKRMLEIEVALRDDNMIVINQSHEFQHDSYIYVDPEQVDLLVKWLIEVKELALLDDKEK